MKVHRHLDHLPPFTNSVITIGTFDGVHKGHQQIINALKQVAQAIGGETVLVTFHPHPRSIVASHKSLQLINTLDEKIALLQQHGIDHLVVVPFTTEFSNLSAQEYVAHFLVDRFHPHTIVIGYDHHFGKGRQGNFALLQEQAPLYGYKLIEIPKHVLHAIDISSTEIRKALQQSDVTKAAELLGYSFFFTGLVIPGDQLGRTIGYPTANLQYTDKDKLHLGQGVYAVEVTFKDQQKKGMLSIGNRPTVNGLEERVEVNIFDFEGDLYGQELTVTVKHFLRPQEKYNSLHALKEQLHKDKKDSLTLL